MAAQAFSVQAAVLVVLASFFSSAAAGLETKGPNSEAGGLCRCLSDQDLLSGPGSNFRIVRTVPAGSYLEIIGQKGSYFRVKVPAGFPCYIHSDYIVIDDDLVGRVSGNRVNLRSIPSIEGDYPLFQVNRGDKLLVWEKKGNWVRVKAPPEAYLYILKSAVVPARSTPENLERIDRARREARQEWEAYVASIHLRREKLEKSQALRVRFRELEAQSDKGYPGMSHKEARKAWGTIRDESSDEMIKKVAQARIKQIDDLEDKNEMKQLMREREKRMRLREEEWRRELKDMETEKAGAKEKKAAKPGAVLPPGRRITVCGRVDASGSKILLRGGKTFDEPLYFVSCPDGRYVIGDFHGKRIAVRGYTGRILPGELPRINVEKVEILL